MSVRLVWDHVVHYVSDLQAPVNAFAGAGLIAARGGSHTVWGTHNTLSFFGLTYLEFLGVEKPQLAKSSDFLIVRDAARLLLETAPPQQTLYRVALRSSDIEATHAALAAKGLAVSPVVDGRRTDTRGNLIAWRIFTIGGDCDGVPYPFVLQWLQTDAERLAALRAAGSDVPHPVGPVRLQEAVFRTADPRRVAAHWRDVFGFAEAPAAEGDGAKAAALVAGEGQRFVFAEGPERRLAEVHFHADNTRLKGTTVPVGQSSYVFV